MSKINIKKNFIKKAILLHDGFENDFILKRNIIDCPYCDGQVEFTVFNSKRLDLESETFKKEIVSHIKGVKESLTRNGSFSYKGQAICFFESKCSLHKHEILTFFTFSEVQPSRYLSYLIGVFG
ncbi:hypothetical protein [Pantoea dispersa]|uniref:hypothetical protein n=1 Tax=Pantoea dispersa TaxID=59814 RepID=UPI00123BC490|nr:hypothetical protein [Pantoea dispersa]KAA8669624.1 hypothetical protein F4W08_15995 [Pantoea dispersa]MDI9764953.1 hypothetical protein [Pantoea dispersa]